MKLKICVLSDINSIHTQRWVRSIADRGIDVRVVSLNNAWDESSVNDIDYKSLNIPLDLVSRPTGWSKVSYLFYALKVRSLVNEYKPDLVHAHYASSYGLMALLSGFRPYIVSLWGDEIINFPKQNFLFRWILGKILRYSTKIFSTSIYMKDLLKDQYGLNATVIPFGIDLNRFTSRSESESEEKNILIGTTKGLRSEHYGYEVLLRAYAGIESSLRVSSKLLIAGDGPDRDFLIKLSSELGIDKNVTFLGRVNHEEIPNFLKSLDLLVNISKWESFGVSVIEASACNVPVLVSNIAGLKEVYVDGVTGLSCEVGSVEDTQRQLSKFLSDHSLRARLGNEGRRFVEDNYVWDDCVDKMIEEYDQLTKNH